MSSHKTTESSTMATKDTSNAKPFTLPLAEEFLAPCPKFRLLVLGNLESTKIEIFSNVLGVKLDKVGHFTGGTLSRCHTNRHRAT